MEHPQYPRVVSVAWGMGVPSFTVALEHVQMDSLVFKREVFLNIFSKKAAVGIQDCGHSEGFGGGGPISSLGYPLESSERE